MIAAEESGLALGIDIGGTGIKSGIVGLDRGELVGSRHLIATPQQCTPEAAADAVAVVVEHFAWSGPVGITLPAVVTDGIARTATNIAPEWIGTDARALFADALGGGEVTVLNDADAAGLAEYRYGAATDGVVVVLTFGTGIGSAVLHDGVLLPNTELGHIEIGGKDAERLAAASVKTREDLTWGQWSRNVDAYLRCIENLLWPDLFVVGGEISRMHKHWIPGLSVRTPIVPAQLLNNAGLVGAAAATSVMPVPRGLESPSSPPFSALIT